MSKFNQTNTGTTKTTNLAGGQAFQESPKLAFVSLLLTSFLKDQYYKSGEDTLTDLISYIDRIEDKKFVAKAAIYARNEFGMRSVSHAVAAELANSVKGTSWIRPFIFFVIRRPDDMTEILSYFVGKYGREKVPNSLRASMKRAFDKFDDYQLAKYRASDKTVKLVDIINFAHPIALTKNKRSMEALIKGTLKASDTWNAELARAGRSTDDDSEKASLKKEVWANLITRDKLPIFASIRNLRNIVQQAPELIDDVCKIITKEESIKKSLIFPFRFVTAIKQLQQDGINEPRIYQALNTALEISFQNVPKLPGKTLVAIDHSGSMDSHGISKQLTNFEIGALSGITLAKTNNADICYFGDICRYAAINPLDSTPTLITYLNSLNNGDSFSYSSTSVGHGTNFSSIFQEARNGYDRICIFSDMQSWRDGGSSVPEFNAYKTRVGVSPKIYSFDLTGHGTLTFPEQDVYCLAGFSDKIFSLMKVMESDKRAMLRAIESTPL